MTPSLRRLTQQLNLVVWLPVGMVLAFGFVASVWANASVRKSRDLVLHSHQVIDAGKDILLAIDDAETGQRGYILTGLTDYLGPYEEGRRTAERSLSKLDLLVADNVSQSSLARQARGYVIFKIRELADVIDVYQRDGFDAARRMILSHAGKSAMDALRDAIGAMETTEASILTARDATVARDERFALIAGAAVALSPS